MLLNENFLLALTSRVFKELSCTWIGAGSDSFLLQNSLLKSPFEKFDTSNILQIINDSEKKIKSDVESAGN